MEEVTIKGMTFEPYLRKEEIAKQVKRVAAEIKRDCADKNPVFLCVLTGAFVFAADLYRACNIHESEVAFIRFKSYEGTQTTGSAKQVMGLSEDIAGRTVIIVEDIVDTGITAMQLRKHLEQFNPKEVKMATLLFKPKSLQVGTPPEYVGFEIPSKFIIGYGLDLDGAARDLEDIYVIKDTKQA